MTTIVDVDRPRFFVVAFAMSSRGVVRRPGAVTHHVETGAVAVRHNLQPCLQITAPQKWLALALGTERRPSSPTKYKDLSWKQKSEARKLSFRNYPGSLQRIVIYPVPVALKFFVSPSALATNRGSYRF